MTLPGKQFQMLIIQLISSISVLINEKFTISFTVIIYFSFIPNIIILLIKVILLNVQNNYIILNFCCVLNKKIYMFVTTQVTT